MVSTTLAGRAEYSAITDNADASSDVTISPAFSASSYNAVRGLQTWYTPSRTSTGSYDNSVAFRVDGVNFRSEAFGCVMESMNISLDSGRLMAEFTFQCAYITDDHGNASGPIEPSL